MGLLYETVTKIEQAIAAKGLEKFKAKGQIALKAGFSLSLVMPDTPDDPEKLRKLTDAAKLVLGSL